MGKAHRIIPSRGLADHTRTISMMCMVSGRHEHRQRDVPEQFLSARPVEAGRALRIGLTGDQTVGGGQGVPHAVRQVDTIEHRNSCRLLVGAQVL